jgi:hypothetical protein
LRNYLLDEGEETYVSFADYVKPPIWLAWLMRSVPQEQFLVFSVVTSGGQAQELLDPKGSIWLWLPFLELPEG